MMDFYQTPRTSYGGYVQVQRSKTLCPSLVVQLVALLLAKLLKIRTEGAGTRVAFEQNPQFLKNLEGGSRLIRFFQHCVFCKTLSHLKTWNHFDQKTQMRLALCACCLWCKCKSNCLFLGSWPWSVLLWEHEPSFCCPEHGCLSPKKSFRFWEWLQP